MSANPVTVALLYIFVKQRGKSLHTCLFGVIGLDAAHIRRLLGHEDLHEFSQTGFELGGRLGRRHKDTGEKRGDGEVTSGRSNRSKR